MVSAYYGDIESDDYADAWALLSPSMQDQLGPYDTWVAGYANTGAQSLTENLEEDSSVNINLSAVDTATGETQYFTGYYTVSDGLIARGSLTYQYQTP